jgi:dihydrofolate reductase
VGQVISSASMSLDGYIAKDDNTIGRLFDWLQNGTVEIGTVNPDITFHLSPTSAEYWKQWIEGLGALVCGRTLFDFTGGWGGKHTLDVPVVVVTHQIPTDWVEAHPEAPFHFVTEGVGAAVARAQAIAGERTVAVTAGTIARQCPWSWARAVRTSGSCRWMRPSSATRRSASRGIASRTSCSP